MQRFAAKMNLGTFLAGGQKKNSIGSPHRLSSKHGEKMNKSLTVRALSQRLGIPDSDLEELLKACKIALVESHKLPVGALGRAEAAKYLGISTRLLDDLLSAETITKIKIGRKTLVRLCDLDAYLAELAGEEVQ